MKGKSTGHSLSWFGALKNSVVNSPFLIRNNILCCVIGIIGCHTIHNLPGIVEVTTLTKYKEIPLGSRGSGRHLCLAQPWTKFG